MPDKFGGFLQQVLLLPLSTMFKMSQHRTHFYISSSVAIILVLEDTDNPYKYIMHHTKYMLACMLNITTNFNTIPKTHTPLFTQVEQNVTHDRC